MRWFCLISLILVASISTAAPDFPELSGRVIDQASMISPAAEADIARMSEAHENATGNQVVVVTLPDLQGYAIEDFGYQLGRHWGIGESGKNNGVLLITSEAERKIRIEVGYGLEGDLTDAVSSNILLTQITPRFKRAQFDEGFVAGTQSIIAALGGEYKMRSTSNQKKTAPTNWFFLIFVILFFIFPAIFGGSIWSLIGLGALSGRSRGRGGFGGGSFGGGGFGGGGGSFGGGGASGGW